MARIEQKDDGYIRFRCPGCGKRLKVRNTTEGGTVIPCPSCHASVVTPMADLAAIAAGGAKSGEEWQEKLNVDPGKVLERLGVGGAGGAGSTTPSAPSAGSRRATAEPRQAAG